MDQELKGHGEVRRRRRRRRVVVSEPSEDGFSGRQIALVVFLGLVLIAALVVILSSLEVPVMRRRF